MSSRHSRKLNRQQFNAIQRRKKMEQRLVLDLESRNDAIDRGIELKFQVEQESESMVDRKLDVLIAKAEWEAKLKVARQVK